MRTSAPLVLVSAPAGAGKSTLITQFAEADDRPFAWIQLDEGDNDPIVLLTYLAHALDGVRPLDPALFELLQAHTPRIEERILPHLEDAVLRTDPSLLILDDAQLIENEACWRILGFLMDRMSGGSQLVLGSRTDPPLPLARLHAAGRVTEFRMVDLAMTRDETARLLGLYGTTADDDTLDTLMDRTEGWITGLCLALLADQTGTRDHRLPPVRGDQRTIAAYFLEEVLDRRPEPVQRFLLHTSIVERLCGSLAGALTGDDEAPTILARLARENVFVAALDDHEEWYRYHHLFAELLRSRLERREPGTLVGLHTAAAEWYRAHGDGEAEVRHRLLAGDADAAAWTAAFVCDDHLVHGRTQSAVRLLDAFTEDQLRASPVLTLTAFEVYGSAADPRQHRWVQPLLTAHVGDGPSPVGNASMRAWQLEFKALLAPNGVSQMRRDAYEADRLEREAQTHWGNWTTSICGCAEYLNGCSRRAEKLIADVLDAALDDDERAGCHAYLALICGDEGRWQEASAHLAALDAYRPPDATLIMTLARARVMQHEGDEGLENELRRTRADFILHTTWKELLRAVALGEIALARGLLDEAAGWSAEADRILAGYPDAGALATRTKQLHRTLEQRRLAEPLTPAERRVLDLLPTQLTAEQMARRLFVSLNTVKSHQRHLYAKLGVATRTAAVERARELRLLPFASS